MNKKSSTLKNVKTALLSCVLLLIIGTAIYSIYATFYNPPNQITLSVSELGDYVRQNKNHSILCELNNKKEVDQCYDRDNNNLILLKR